jgi:hypothetical protein
MICSMRPALLLAALVLTSAFAPSAFADALRCGNRLVTLGDTRSAVLSICGDPVEVETRTILRRPTFTRNGRVFYLGEGFVEVPVEIWTYNFGPYKLLRRVRFVDGQVDDIETLGYGYRERGE